MSIRHPFIRLFVYSLISLLTIPLLWNLLKPGFYSSHDGEWMVIRLTAFHDALRQGQFPVRWLPRLNHGYGYPVANFLYPLPFYLAEPIYFLTGNPTTAIQFIMAISILSMMIGMYLFLSNNQQLTINNQQFTSRSFAAAQDDAIIKWSAIIGTLVYVYSPYVAFNLYQRGSLGEIVAMGIVPWIFWAISRNKLPIVAILIAALIMSHNVVAILFLPLAAIYLFRHCEERSDVAIPTRLPRFGTSDVPSLAMTFTIGFGLSAFFWLPALAELRFVRAGQISISDFQNEYLNFTEALNRTGIITAIFSAGSPLFFLTKSSSWLWETLKFAQVIQFPWRLLSLFSFIAAIISAKFITKISGMPASRHCEERSDVAIPTRLPRFARLTGSLAMTIIVITSFLSSIKYLTPASFINRPPEYYQTNDDTTTVRAEYTPIWVTDLPKQRSETPQIHYYPGWRAFINGKPVPLTDPEKTAGTLEAINHRSAGSLGSARDDEMFAYLPVKYVWGETPLRTFANLLSIAAALVWLRWFSTNLDSHPQPQ